MSFKVSTKGRYGLRLMLDLGHFYDNRLATVKEIGERNKISGKYLEQIITLLGKAKLVESVRGAHGGYKLALPPKNITVGMILRAVEGDLSPVHCVEDDNCGCEEMEGCATISIWKKIKDAVDDVVDNITLETILKDYEIGDKSSCGGK